MTVVDPVAAIRQILLNDATVTGLVADRIFGEIDEDQAAVMPQACIVLKASGGPKSPGGGYQQYGTIRIDVIAYGSDLYESWLVYLAAYNVLKAIRRQTVQPSAGAAVLVHSADTQSKGSTARDPEKQWPVTYSSWLVLHSEIAAA